jgi:hypothetical protein
MRAWLQETDGIHAEAINGGFEAAVARAARQLATRVDLALDGGAGDGHGPPARTRDGVDRPDARHPSRGRRREPARAGRRISPPRGSRP